MTESVDAHCLALTAKQTSPSKENAYGSEQEKQGSIC